MGLINYCQKAPTVGNFQGRGVDRKSAVEAFCGKGATEATNKLEARSLARSLGRTSASDPMSEEDLDERLRKISERYNFSLSRGH